MSTSLLRIAEDADRRAEAHEREVLRLALTLFALERVAILRALERARTDVERAEVLAVAVAAYRSPAGFFRERWRRRFTELFTDQARAEARRSLPVVGRQAQRVAVPTELTPAARAAIERRATELADVVSTQSAARLEAVARAVAQEVRDRAAQVAPAAPPGGQGGGGPPRPPVRLLPAGASGPDPRLETLVPLVGREAAEEIMRVIREGRAGNLSMAKVARSLSEQVHATEVTRVRAVRIARTETIGLVNLTEFERASATGVLREKRWITQGDDRVRDSHRRNESEGWIAIQARFSNGLRYPGERPAQPEEVINCRCTLAYRA